ncbi:prolipoprotein diacylglyceryl transferase [Candidatus Woesearchaeota archaeon]|nr:MAG: prolipoprotein diacylglyceryl transferase [Candidatus Woesearchaeota archaeon]
MTLISILALSAQVFTHNFSPTIFTLGPFALRWYSLVWVTGFLTAYYLLLRVARTRRIKGLTADTVDGFVSWLVIGTVIGARTFYALFYNPTYFLAQPWKFFFVWEGGLSFHGGFLGAFIAAWWYTKRAKLDFWKLADFLVIPLAFFLCLGRIANFINAELVGTVTDVAWCVTYPNQPWIEGCRHPSQFYEAGKNLIIFAVLLPLWSKKRYAKLKEGTLFWLFVTLYGLGRFITNFWRAPDLSGASWATTTLLGLTLGQWLSLIMVVLGAIMLTRLFQQDPA